jgi:hypothetical protein
MAIEDVFEICKNTILWTIIGALLGAIFGVLFTHLYNKKFNKIKIRAWIWQNCLSDGITKDPNLMLSIINDSNISIPKLNAHIMDYSGLNVSFERIDSDIQEIKPRQITQFRIMILESEKKLSNDAKMILQAKQKDFALRIYIDKSNKGPIYTDRALANEIFHSISELVGRDYRKKTLIEDLPYEEKQKILNQLKEMQDDKK